MGRLIKGVVYVVLVLLVGSVGIVAALAYLPFFAPQRQLAAEQLLERFVDRPVSISGDVVLVPGAVTSVDITGITIGAAASGGGFKQLTIDDTAFGFQLLPVLRGDFELEQITADGIVLTTPPPSDAGDQALPVSSFFLSFAELLESQGTRDLVLHDFSIVSDEDPDGWAGAYKLTELVAKQGDATGDRVISASGTINGKAAKIDATFAAATAEGGDKPVRKFSITTSLPGYESESTGTIDADGSALDGTFAANISSLGDFLELLRLEREFDGTAKLTMNLAGPADAIAAESIKLSGQLSTGERLSIEGRIANFSQGTGVDVTFAADLKRKDGSVPRPSSAFDIELDKITGGAKGEILSLTLANLVFSTNLADADLARIGPVSVEKVERDKDGKLALRGLHILSGDPKAPSLDLKGNVLDALNQSGISLAGSFDLDALDLIVGKPAPPEIGRLEGKLAIGDASGGLRLESLSGKLTGDGPLELTLDVPPPGEGTASSPLRVELDVTDLAALAEAFGAEATGDGSVTFDGSIALDDALEVDGKATIGRSPLTIDLQQDVTDGEAVFRGKLDSSGLFLGDLQSLTALQGIGAWFEDDTAPEITDDTASSPPSWLDAELDVAATIVAEDGAEQAELAAHFAYRDGKAALDPLTIGYAGGTLEASAGVGLGEAAPPVSLDGTANQFQLSDIERAFGGTPLVDAPLSGKLSLRADGTEVEQLARSVGGHVQLRVGAGTVGTSLIDLTGESIVEWLFTSSDHAELVCGVGSIAFKAGKGTIERLVIETANVQLVGVGSFDLGKDKIDIGFTPRPLERRLIELVTPIHIHGKLSAPKISTGSTAALAGRAVAETLTLPLTVVSALVDLGRNSGRKPCESAP